ncbi:MAG TPA: fluoride efflux transporter CrcB [Longimicrobium sp.]|nr:fluoride efflux transporter CrcB [Longimicrobium sp.]
MPWLYVAAGGAAGSLLRYAAGQALGPPRPGTFPWHTFWVNVAGSLILGLVLAVVARDDPHHLRALLAVGFCGGLTTFSTFSWETVGLIESRAYGLAEAYVGASLLIGILAVVLGLWVGARLAQ